MDRRDILSMTLGELSDELTALGEKKFRAGQVFAWLHQKKAEAFGEMTDLPKGLRAMLCARYYLSPAKIHDIKISKDKTRKYLLELPNNTIIESVLMEYEYGSTVCVSSQAGCKMGCAFCASQYGGFHRDLTAGEMLSQIYAIEKQSGGTASRAVIMGCGEPFDNFGSTMRFVELLNSEKGHNMGIRNITVSTCGIVPKIYELADMETQVNLAVSLHAPNNEIRRRIMPIAAKYPYEELIGACGYYAKKTRRRVTFEYVLIDGINDGNSHAKELADVIKGMLCHVNIIPANEVAELSVKPSGNTEGFSGTLKRLGINSTVRRSLGGDIDGACGQLRRHYIDINGRQPEISE